MKIIDSKGKLFSKINIIDLAIVIVVAVLALSAFVKFDKAEKTMTSDKVIEYTVKISGIRKPTIDALNKNPELKEDKTKKALGEITDMEISKTTNNVQLADGTYKKVELQDKYDLLLTVCVKGTETEDNFYTMEGQKLIVGDHLDINNENVLCYGAIKSVKIAEQ